MNKGEKLIAPMYVLGLLGMLVIVIAVYLTRESDQGGKGTTDYIDISADWTLDREGTEPADLSRLGGYMDEETGVLSIYHRLPPMDGDESLVFRSKDVYTKLLIDGEVIYETEVYESRFYNRSPGNLWNIVKLHDNCSEALVELQIDMVYDTNAVTVDHTMWGDKTDIIQAFLKEKAFGITVSMLMAIIGLILIAIGLMPAYSRARKNHGMIWLGLYAVLISVWSVIETNVIQFLVTDMRILQLIDNMILILDSMPLLLYLNCEYQIFRNRFMRVFCYVDSLYIFAAVLIQLSGVSDLHLVLHVAGLAMIASCVILLVWVTVELCRRIRRHQVVLNYVLQLSGMGALGISTLCEIVRHSQSDHMDRAEYMRVGMLVFIVCLAVSSQLETYRLFENGLKYDIISSLAYSDGLTGLGNRTAYLEQIEAYAGGETGISQLGIVFLDVNDLKKVNDNQGHEKGDELLSAASKIIADSFGRYGKAYRIGGDEFCVLMTGVSLQESYEAGLAEFRKLIREANMVKGRTYEIQIANGFIICDTARREKIDEAVTAADTAMYENKRFLKNRVV